MDPQKQNTTNEGSLPGDLNFDAGGSSGETNIETSQSREALEKGLLEDVMKLKKTESDRETKKLTTG